MMSLYDVGVVCVRVLVVVVLRVKKQWEDSGNHLCLSVSELSWGGGCLYQAVELLDAAAAQMMGSCLVDGQLTLLC